MFSIFNKNKAKTITKMGRDVIVDVQIQCQKTLENDSIAQTKNQKPNTDILDKKKYIQYITTSNDIYKGVYLTKVYSKKWDTTIYLIVTTHCDKKRVSTTLKWINERFCTSINPYSTNRIPNDMFVLDNWDISHCTYNK